MLNSCDLSCDNSNLLAENIQSSINAVNSLLASLEQARLGEGLREEQVGC